MLFINHTSNSQAAKDYFSQELAQADYYMKDGQQISGKWHGLGAKALGLEGAIDKESFERLCDNQHPLTGEQLTARMKANRRVTRPGDAALRTCWALGSKESSRCVVGTWSICTLAWLGDTVRRIFWVPP